MLICLSKRLASSTTRIRNSFITKHVQSIFTEYKMFYDIMNVYHSMHQNEEMELLLLILDTNDGCKTKVFCTLKPPEINFEFIGLII